jgi:hypothetical protein
MHLVRCRRAKRGHPGRRRAPCSHRRAMAGGCSVTARSQFRSLLKQSREWNTVSDVARVRARRSAASGAARARFLAPASARRSQRLILTHKRSSTYSPASAGEAWTSDLQPQTADLCSRCSETRPVGRSESRPPEGGPFYALLIWVLQRSDSAGPEACGTDCAKDRWP